MSVPEVPHGALSGFAVGVGGRLASGPFGIKGFGYFFHINILILIVFNVKILPQKGQLKSSDSSMNPVQKFYQQRFETGPDDSFRLLCSQKI